LVEFRLERSSATFFRFCSTTGRACDTAEALARMLRRVVTAFALALAIGACEATAQGAAPIAGVGDVRVLATRIVPATESGPGLNGGTVTYLIATVDLTNGSIHDAVPSISRFILTTSRSVRYSGVDSGASALVGVSNSHTMLKHGETRTYTVGFRTTDPVIAGTVSYEP
jgi:hypothetical protein